MKLCFNEEQNLLISDRDSEQNSSNRVPDPTLLSDAVDSNRTYAVFISYCEIYNSFIYDLLEDTRDPITGRCGH